MSSKLLSSSFIMAAVLTLVAGSQCFADDDFPAPTSLPAIRPTVVTATTQSDGNFRIKRDYKPRLYGGVSTSKMLPNLPYVSATPSTDPLVQANDYASGTSESAFVPAKQSPVTQGTYVWFQSADGGYYDGSGQFKTLVQGDLLYKYGGHFADGSPVPSTPVVCNFAGHVYKPFVVKRMP